MDSILSARAEAIVIGLIRTGRASWQRVADGHIQLRAKRDSGFYWYWITADGRLLRGDDLDRAEELQPKFVEAMVQAGH